MNRRRFFEEADRIHAECQNSGVSAAFLMLDIDHFKTINDRFGHGIGDAVLVEFTKRCRAVLHPLDRFGRMGGEEFAVVLTRPDGASVHAMAERLRQVVSSVPFIIDTDSLNVTVSIGGAVCDVSESVGSAISRADNGLYDAKKTGRDRVIVR